MNEPKYIFIKPNDVIIKEFNDNDIRGVIENFTLAIENNHVYLKEANAVHNVEMWIPIEKFNKLIKLYNEITKFKES